MRDARTQLGLALDAGARVGDPAGQAHAHHYLCERQGRRARVLDHTEQALVLYRSADHRHGQTAALNAIGWYRAHLGDRYQEACILPRLAGSFQAAGDPRASRAARRVALTILVELGCSA